jgi:hypothetical protein
MFLQVFIIQSFLTFLHGLFSLSIVNNSPLHNGFSTSDFNFVSSYISTYTGQNLTIESVSNCCKLNGFNLSIIYEIKKFENDDFISLKKLTPIKWFIYLND